jgi:hypothetical protein
MDTAKTSIATPTAKRKLDRKDIDYILNVFLDVEAFIQNLHISGLG